jgi:deoxyadenosine/deoxycytidine kinase
MLAVYIVGNIGCGKSTFIKALSKYFLENNFDHLILEEPVNEWLNIVDVDGKNVFDAFYTDPKRNAFVFQLLCQLSRKNMEDQIDPSCRIYFTERSLKCGNDIFTKHMINKNILTTEQAIFLKDKIQLVNKGNVTCYVYLYTPANVCLERIKRRNRPGEEKITIEYLQDLEVLYNDYNFDIKINAEKEIDCEKFVDILTMCLSRFHEVDRFVNDLNKSI